MTLDLDLDLDIDLDVEKDGRWIAEIVALPGALAYGSTAVEARQKVELLAGRVLAERDLNE